MTAPGRAGIMGRGGGGAAGRLPAEHDPRAKKRLEEHSDRSLELLWWLFRHKNIMPWAAYEHIRRPGFRDLTWALTSHECDGGRKNNAAPGRGGGKC